MIWLQKKIRVIVMDAKAIVIPGAAVHGADQVCRAQVFSFGCDMPDELGCRMPIIQSFIIANAAGLFLQVLQVWVMVQRRAAQNLAVYCEQVPGMQVFLIKTLRDFKEQAIRRIYLPGKTDELVKIVIAWAGFNDLKHVIKLA